MSARAVQISIDEELLSRIDNDEEAKKLGRSAFIRAALELYLRARERNSIDQAIEAAYSNQADDLLHEIEEIMGAQAWPKP